MTAPGGTVVAETEVPKVKYITPSIAFPKLLTGENMPVVPLLVLITVEVFVTPVSSPLSSVTTVVTTSPVVPTPVNQRKFVGTATAVTEPDTSTEPDTETVPVAIVTDIVCDGANQTTWPVATACVVVMMTPETVTVPEMEMVPVATVTVIDWVGPSHVTGPVSTAWAVVKFNPETATVMPEIVTLTPGTTDTSAVPETDTEPVTTGVPETETEPVTVAVIVCVGASHMTAPVPAACVVVTGVVPPDAMATLPEMETEPVTDALSVCVGPNQTTGPVNTTWDVVKFSPDTATVMPEMVTLTPGTTDTIAVPETDTEPVTVADMVCVGASQMAGAFTATCVAVAPRRETVPLTSAVTLRPGTTDTIAVPDTETEPVTVAVIVCVWASQTT